MADTGVNVGPSVPKGGEQPVVPGVVIQLVVYPPGEVLFVRGHAGYANGLLKEIDHRVGIHKLGDGLGGHRGRPSVSVTSDSCSSSSARATAPRNVARRPSVEAKTSTGWDSR